MELLNRAQEELGLSRQDLCRMLGLPSGRPQTIRDWEAGRRQMDDARVRLLQAYLDGYRPDDWPQGGACMMDKRDELKQPDTVPIRHPYGSITDGDWVCGRCREPITGCMICAGEVRHIVPLSRSWNKDSRHDRD